MGSGVSASIAERVLGSRRSPFRRDFATTGAVEARHRTCGTVHMADSEEAPTTDGGAPSSALGAAHLNVRFLEPTTGAPPCVPATRMRPRSAKGNSPPTTGAGAVIGQVAREEGPPAPPRPASSPRRRPPRQGSGEAVSEDRSARPCSEAVPPRPSRVQPGPAIAALTAGAAPRQARTTAGATAVVKTAEATRARRTLAPWAALRGGDRCRTSGARGQVPSRTSPAGAPHRGSCARSESSP
jgi:hypothetical protein